MLTTCIIYTYVQIVLNMFRLDIIHTNGATGLNRDFNHQGVANVQPDKLNVIPDTKSYFTLEADRN